MFPLTFLVFPCFAMFPPDSPCFLVFFYVFPVFPCFSHVFFFPISQVFLCFSLILPVFPCVYTFCPVFPCFCLILPVFPCFSMFFPYSPCFPVFFYVFPCYPMLFCFSLILSIPPFFCYVLLWFSLFFGACFLRFSMFPRVLLCFCMFSRDSPVIFCSPAKKAGHTGGRKWYREYFMESAGVRYLGTSCWPIGNLTSERSERVRFLIQKHKWRWGYEV